MISSERLALLESRLNHFDPQARAQALAELLNLANQGEILFEPQAEVCNMHCHTFFSFNAYGHSPTSLAWLGKRAGYEILGIVDFDVLDGVDEFLNAAALAGIKGSAGIETRVFVPEFSNLEINSPGEPGIAYHMGIGFTSSNVPETTAPLLASLRQRASQRNWSVVERVNAYLFPLEIDYAQDVLPLTPAGAATERHIVLAYIRAAERQIADCDQYWATKLQLPLDQVSLFRKDSPKFQNQIRAKLMKRGGPGYVEPTPDMFPTIEEFHDLILSCNALPCAAWLDGTSAGEQAIGELLELFMRKGVVALNIIPDRNWNIPDPKVRATKVQYLSDIINLARELDLPLHVGTEMNSFGQKLVDDFDAPEIAPFKRDFIDGALFIFGHTILQRAINLGYQSEWAKAYLPTRKDRNQFYTQVGRLSSPDRRSLDRLHTIKPTMTPGDILNYLQESEGKHD